MTKASYTGHDVASADMAKTILTRMKFPSNVVNTVSDLAFNHMKAHDLTNTKKAHKIRRFFGQSNISLLKTLVTADEKATVHENSNSETKFMDLFEKATEQWSEMLPKPLVTGEDLIGLGFKPSPLFRKVLDGVFNRQLDGENDKDNLLSFSKHLFKSATGVLK